MPVGADGGLKDAATYHQHAGPVQVGWFAAAAAWADVPGKQKNAANNRVVATEKGVLRSLILIISIPPNQGGVACPPMAANECPK